MAVTKSLTSAVPYVSGGKVFEWDIEMTYVNGVSGDEQYFTREYQTIVSYEDETYGFGLSAESDWNTQQQLLDLCPIINWEDNFNETVQQVFNPPVVPEPDNTYQIPAT